MWASPGRQRCQKSNIGVHKRGACTCAPFEGQRTFLVPEPRSPPLAFEQRETRNAKRAEGPKNVSFAAKNAMKAFPSLGVSQRLIKCQHPPLSPPCTHHPPCKHAPALQHRRVGGHQEAPAAAVQLAELSEAAAQGVLVLALPTPSAAVVSDVPRLQQRGAGAAGTHYI